MKVANLKRIRQLWQLGRFGPYIAGCIIFVILPLLLPTHLESLMSKFLILAIFAMSWNIIAGYTGLFSLGHAAFLGVGGYTTGILILHYGIKSFWISAPCGIVMAVLVAVVFGFIALQVSGMYFLLVTFALGMLLNSVAIKWYSMTGGSDGLVGIPLPDLGLSFTWDATSFYYFTFIFFIICLFLVYRLVNSPFGHALQGIRESETRMRALGYNTWLYKYIAFIIAGLFAGVAGMLLAHFNGIMSPYDVGCLTSFAVTLYVILGGIGTLGGPIVGSLVIIFLEYFSSIYTPERWPLILGSIFVIVVMLLRGGVVPHLLKLWKRVSYGSIKG